MRVNIIRGIAPFPTSAFTKLDNMEVRNWWFIARNKLILWSRRTLALDFNNFLEIGCGTGDVLNAVNRKFPHAEVFGAEFYEKG